MILVANEIEELIFIYENLVDRLNQFQKEQSELVLQQINDLAHSTKQTISTINKTIGSDDTLNFARNITALNKYYLGLMPKGIKEQIIKQYQNSNTI